MLERLQTLAKKVRKHRRDLERAKAAGSRSPLRLFICEKKLQEMEICLEQALYECERHGYTVEEAAPAKKNLN